MKSFPGMLFLLVRRAQATPQLLAIRFAGVLMAVTLVAGVSLYSGAMGDAMLRQRLNTDPTNVNIDVSLSGQPLTGAQYTALDTYIAHGAARDLGLPLLNQRVHHYTSTLRVFRLQGNGNQLAPFPLVTLPLDYYQGLQNQVNVYGGSMDTPARMSNGDAPVYISTYTARTLNLRPGDRLAFAVDRAQPIAPPLVVAGVFVATNPNSAFWDIHAGDASYRSLLTPNLSTFQIYAAQGSLFSPDYSWFQQTSVSAIHLANATAIINALTHMRSKVAALAPGTILITSLDVAINGFTSQYTLLGTILLILVAPIVALILYGVTVTTALALDRQASEIVLMRSRGATRGQIFALHTGEGVLLGLVALLIGPLIGLPFASVVGRASGFLLFGGALPFDLHLLPETYLYSGITALLCLLVGLLPAMGLAGRTMVSFKGEQARQRRRPLWQRLYLDFVVLAVALYGLNVLVRQGPVSSGDATSAVADDPIIAIAPLFFAVAITLFISRILPWLASLGLHVMGAFSSPSAHVALQSVARAPRQPMRLVQLCTLTLTLGIFAATVAGVEASNLTDQYLYQAGSTLRLHEAYDRTQAPPNLRNEPDAMPIAAHLALPGVHAATPALRFESFGNVVNMLENGTTLDVLGIDPATAGRVMWYRSDFAGQDFNSLVRSIRTPGPNVIVSQSLLNVSGMHRGDTFDVSLNNNVSVTFKVAAVASYFPSLDPSQEPFVVANLTYLNTMSKSHGPNEVWLSTDANQAAINRILIAVNQWPRQIISYVGLPPADAAQGNPLSAGIYGVVSVGFLIAAAIALLGFASYAYLTLQQRLTEVAILRALGLSPGQVRSLLLFEQVFLLGAAILGGIVAGLLTTQLFLPYMPIATNVVPPFQVVMPWLATGEFVLAVLVVFVIIISLLVSLLLRVQLGRVLRLGEG